MANWKWKLLLIFFLGGAGLWDRALASSSALHNFNSWSETIAQPLHCLPHVWHARGRKLRVCVGVVNHRHFHYARLTSIMDEVGGASSRELAIEVRGAYKGYGSIRVLKGLDMSVPRGHMWGYQLCIHGKKIMKHVICTVAMVCLARVVVVRLPSSAAFWVGSTWRVAPSRFWARLLGPLATKYLAGMSATCHRYLHLYNNPILNIAILAYLRYA